jgi:predicted secreted protein
MAGVAAYVFTVSVCATEGGTYQECDATSESMERLADLLDSTTTANAGYRTRLAGLLDSSITIETNWAASNAAKTILEAGYEGRSTVYVKVLPNNTTGEGKRFPALVESISESADISGLVTHSFSLQGNGAVVADNAA